tara:strand:+ start:7725 stop:8174 length:450 start_codon:yes stop_codon:yes gene_type:complete
MSEEFTPIPKMLLSRSDYVLPALYQWMLENDGEPQLVVNTIMEGVFAPPNLINPDGNITYNLSPNAITGLEFSGGYVSFYARFNGQNTHVTFPTMSVLYIFDRVSRVSEQVNTIELQQWTINNGGSKQVQTNNEPPAKQSGKSFLKLVK